ncbi:hypothetical protein O6H91_12G066200 [Diphasiastrum complanatum]|uniref:Uncharacterized protein n=1 Tax=Diphasiastrum complanatum TaxID=34168 RepID=A0ACC2C2S2_DIPCM|nr:hypothetical protein O6H91_12G066200 [Diphasiastrum complanatum]
MEVGDHQRLGGNLICIAAAMGCLLALCEASSWTPCDPNGHYKVIVKDVNVIPDPVVAGSPATFEIPAYTSQNIAGGKVVITVFYRGFPVHTELDDLCGKTSCPIEAGDFIIRDSQVLPGYTPPGPYKIKLLVLGSYFDMLACTNIDFNIVASTGTTQENADIGLPSGIMQVVEHP